MAGEGAQTSGTDFYAQLVTIGIWKKFFKHLPAVFLYKMILEVFYALGKYCSSKCPRPAELVELKYSFRVCKNFSNFLCEFLWLVTYL